MPTAAAAAAACLSSEGKEAAAAADNPSEHLLRNPLPFLRWAKGCKCWDEIEVRPLEGGGRGGGSAVFPAGTSSDCVNIKRWASSLGKRGRRREARPARRTQCCHPIAAGRPAEEESLTPVAAGCSLANRNPEPRRCQVDVSSSLAGYPLDCWRLSFACPLVLPERKPTRPDCVVPHILQQKKEKKKGRCCTFVNGRKKWFRWECNLLAVCRLMFKAKLNERNWRVHNL